MRHANPESRKAVSMRLPVDLADNLTRHAAADRRTVTDLVIAVMQLWCDGKTYQPIARPAPVDQSDVDPAPATVTLYQRLTGRPRVAKDSAREPWLIEKLEQSLQHTDADAALTLDQISSLSGFGPHASLAPGFDAAIENQLLLLGWQPALHVQSGAVVWRNLGAQSVIEAH